MKLLPWDMQREMTLYSVEDIEKEDQVQVMKEDEVQVMKVR